LNHCLQRAESAKTRQEDEFKDSVDSKCFPADTVVFTTSGTKPIADVQVGDYLSTTCGFSSVYLLAHANDNIVSTFVEITTDSQHILQLSPAHYIKVNGHHSCAKNVKIGDSLRVRINGMNHTSLTYQEARVTEVREVEKTGLYSPFTMCGDIEVVSNEMNSGVIASIYSDWFLEGLGVDPSTIPGIYHMLLMPLRLVHDKYPEWTWNFASYFQDSEKSLHQEGVCKLIAAGIAATLSIL
jgi:hypothetical protein